MTLRLTRCGICGNWFGIWRDHCPACGAMCVEEGRYAHATTGTPMSRAGSIPNWRTTVPGTRTIGKPTADLCQRRSLPRVRGMCGRRGLTAA